MLCNNKVSLIRTFFIIFFAIHDVLSKNKAQIIVTQNFQIAFQ